MSNEQKLRAALLALVGVNDDIAELDAMKVTLIPAAVGNEDVQICIGAIQVLIDTHPDTAPTYSAFSTLEVGRTYRTRGGAEVTITEHTGRHDRPFRSDGGNTYTEHGRYYGCDNSALDLMAVRNV